MDIDVAAMDIDEMEMGFGNLNMEIGRWKFFDNLFILNNLKLFIRSYFELSLKK